MGHKGRLKVIVDCVSYSSQHKIQVYIQGHVDVTHMRQRIHRYWQKASTSKPLVAYSYSTSFQHVNHIHLLLCNNLIVIHSLDKRLYLVSTVLVVLEVELVVGDVSKEEDTENQMQEGSTRSLTGLGLEVLSVVELEGVGGLGESGGSSLGEGLVERHNIGHSLSVGGSVEGLC